MLLFCFFAQIIESKAQTEYSYFPDNDWLSTNPEDQGIDSNILSQLYNYIEDYGLFIESVLIIRNGYIIDENYLYNHQIYEEDQYPPYITSNIRYRQLHVLYSCTKSIVSLLIGIAIDKGFIDDTNQTFFSIFPDKWKPSYGDEGKKNITIKNLLTQSSGLQWDEATDAFSGWWSAGITLDYVLNKPLVAEPGTFFEYSSGNVHLLSAIIQNKTGMKTSEFANQYLFEPIGINISDWEWDETDWEWGVGSLDNISFGGFGAYMTPRAMARIGLLCLNRGNWNGTQILSENWIAKSSSSHITSDFAGNPGYGYLFWIAPDYYSAVGFLGQRITIIPDLNIVVVFTAQDYYVDSNYDVIIDQYIRKAVISNSSPQIPGYNLWLMLGVASIISLITIRNRNVKKNS